MRIQEVVTGVYPWDLIDEGADTVMRNIVEQASCNGVYMIALMHYEKRPRSEGAYFPHNPARKEYLAEDSRAYWLPNPAAYKDSRIKPVTSERDFLKGTDWLDLMIESARKRGLKTGAEISHTPLDMARATSEFKDVTQRDVYGRVFPERGAQCVCHYNSDVRNYVYALAYDLAKNHDLDFVQSCMIPFLPGRPELHPLFGIALGGCWCDACARAAREQGLDWEAMKRDGRKLADYLVNFKLEDQQYMLKVKDSLVSDVKLLMERPGFYEWLRFRARGVAGCYKAMRDGAKAGNPKIDFRLNTCWPHGDQYGLDIAEFATFCDSIRVMEYSEQFGDWEILNKRKPGWLTNVRREAGNDIPIIASVAIRPRATVDMIKRGIEIAAQTGMDGLSLAFYDGASFPFMNAVAEGMREAGLTVG